MVAQKLGEPFVQTVMTLPMTSSKDDTAAEGFATIEVTTTHSASENPSIVLASNRPAVCWTKTEIR
jgi:hypothetical protein